VWEEDENGEFGNDGRWVDGPLLEYLNKKAMEKAAKEELSEGLMPE
jgi:hypothetical protein